MIYLNNSATSYPKPQKVIEDINEYLKQIPFHSFRAGFEVLTEDKVYTCRKKIAKLFNIQNPNNIIFTSGATESLNLAIFGLSLDDKHVITTAIEHNSVLRPLKKLEDQGLIELSIISPDTYGIIDPNDIKKNIKQNTKLIVINHCSNVTGAIVDIKRISKIAKKRNIILLVDASQSAGLIPVDSEDLDILVFTGHKFLYGMPGIGVFYKKDKINIEPLKVGGTGIKSELLYQPKELPIYYEAGTLNTPGVISLSAGISFVLEIGLKKIKSKIDHLFDITMQKLEKIGEVIIYNNTKNKSNSIISFNLKNIDPADVGYILENSFEIVVRTGLHCAPLIHKFLGSYPNGSVRISFSYFSTECDVNHFIDAVKQICKEAK